MKCSVNYFNSATVTPHVDATMISSIGAYIRHAVMITFYHFAAATYYQFTHIPQYFAIVSEVITNDMCQYIYPCSPQNTTNQEPRV